MRWDVENLLARGASERGALDNWNCVVEARLELTVIFAEALNELRLRRADDLKAGERDGGGCARMEVMDADFVSGRACGTNALVASRRAVADIAVKKSIRSEIE